MRPVLSALLCFLMPTAAVGQERASLSLEAAVRLALRVAPEIAGARHALEGAEAARRETRAARLPSLTAEGSAFRFEEPMLVAPIHGFTPGLVPEFDQTLYQGVLGLGYTVFDGGARRARTREADAWAGVADAGLDGTEQAVIAVTVRAYLEVLSARGGVDAEARRQQALASESARVQRFLAEGRAARVEALRAEAALAQAGAEAATAAARLELAERDLARQLKVAVEDVRAGLLVAVGGPPDEPPARDDLLRRAREHSPELRAADGRLTAARAARRGAGASWWPVLRLEGRLMTYGAANAPTTAEWQTGLRLSYPLFTGGARSAGTDRAAAAEREAEALRDELERRVATRVDRALVDATEAAGRAEALAAAVRHLEEVVRVEALAREEGAGTQTDYLRSEAELAQARVALIRARHAAVLAHVELARATGQLRTDLLPTIVRTEP